MEEVYNKTIRVENPVEIAHKMIDHSATKIIGVVGYYETIVDILNWLIKNTDAEFVEGELHAYEYDHYEDAFVLEYYENEIYINKFANEHNHLTLSCDNTYVEEDFVDEYAETNIMDEDVIIFGYSDVDNSNDGNYFCMDDDLCGFCCCIDNTKFKYRGSVKLTTDMINKILNDFLD
jgi:hypothetical protein